jgi:RimJ/RimL family protein N-acetyltransferase
VAGVHAVSRQFGVAAVGNIATRPALRGRGYAQRVTAALCTALVGDGLQVGLNVGADNAAAIAAYRRVGFDVLARYDELTVTLPLMFPKPPADEHDRNGAPPARGVTQFRLSAVVLVGARRWM